MLKPCPECSGKISSNASTCPHCGNPLEKEAQQSSKVSLGTFVETNQRMLTVIGIFTALTVFSFNLPLKRVGAVLAFILVAITILLWWEFIGRMPEKREWSLLTFHHLVSLVLWLVFGYWLLDFGSIWQSSLRWILCAPIAVVITMLGMWCINRMPALKKKWGAKPKWVRGGMYEVVYVVILALSFVLASLVSVPLNRMLESMRKEVKGESSSGTITNLGSTKGGERK